MFSIFKKKENNKKLAIEKTKIIDYVSVNKDDNSLLVLMLIDNIYWSNRHFGYLKTKQELIENEFKHMGLIQEKINSYLAYIETKQYEPKFKNINKFSIEIHHMEKPSKNCTKLIEKNLIPMLADQAPNIKVKRIVGYGDNNLLATQV